MNNQPAASAQKTPAHKPRPLLDLLLSIIIPSAILMKLSGDNDLGATGALLAALAFPISWGLYELNSCSKYQITCEFPRSW